MARSLAYAVWAATMSLYSALVFGQAATTGAALPYPSKPVRIITSEAGGGADFVSRLLAQEMAGGLGNPVIVENRGGIVAPDLVVKAAPDGYTLLGTADNVWLAPLIRKTSYDAVTDFAPISLVGKAPLVLAVHPSVPVKSVKELISLAKRRPGELNYGTSTIGTPVHLAAELFKPLAGVNVVGVYYKGSAQALTAIISGEVQIMFGTVGTVMPHVKSGRLKPLAVTSAQPSTLAPGLPAVAASGLPGYEVAVTYSVFAPSKTPSAIINRLNQELVRILGRADVTEKFLKAGGIEAAASTPEQLAATVKSEMAKFGKVIKEAGIRVDGS